MINKEQLLGLLKDCKEDLDVENNHRKADDALLAFINDVEVTQAFEDIERWYS
jgi:hypothetical protein